jgi:DNA-binding NarL/FixJ family response regulator
MNGYETSKELQKKYPNMKVLVITMVEDEQSLIKMLKHGIRGYLSKDVEPDELKKALDTIAMKGYYYTDHLTGKLIHAIRDNEQQKDPVQNLNEREMKFLQLACSEYTYKEIADIMCLSIKTIDGYRNALFEKLQAKSRVGLVLYAIRNNLVSL